MKAARVAVFAALGMCLTGASVYGFTPAGGFKIAADPSSTVASSSTGAGTTIEPAKARRTCSWRLAPTPTSPRRAPP